MQVEAEVVNELSLFLHIF